MRDRCGPAKRGFHSALPSIDIQTNWKGGIDRRTVTEACLQVVIRLFLNPRQVN
jgi:hypothetical protein